MIPDQGRLVNSTVTGSFGSYNGQVKADGENFENAKATFTADIDSISTNNDDLNHSSGFFNSFADLSSRNQVISPCPDFTSWTGSFSGL